MKYNRLTIVSSKGKYYECLCECGTVKQILQYNVRSGNTKSCGCLHKERTKEANSTHGWSKTAMYMVWKAMIRRCENPNHDAYKYYGGRGIKVCPEWRSNFVRFALDMGADYQPGLTLDRKDSSKDYSKNNCQWLTKSQNAAKGGGYLDVEEFS